MNQLQLIKSENFGEVQCDIYKKDNDLFMTIAQLAEALNYANGRKGAENS